MLGEECAVVIAHHVGLARRRRRAGHQGDAFAKAQGRTIVGFGEHFDPGVVAPRAGGAPVGGTAHVHRGLRAAVEHLAGHGEEVGLQGPGRALDAYEVGVVGAAGHGLGEVRVADEGFDGAGVRIHRGVGAVDAAQERPDRTVDRTAENPRCTDADVPGDVDRTTSGSGDVDRFHTIGVGNGVGPGSGNIYPHANPREADLVAVDRVAAGKGSLDPGDISVHAIAGGIVGDAGFGQVPEGFVRPVIREHHRLGVVENPGCRQQGAHVRRWHTGSDPCADGAGLAQFHRQLIVVLIPDGEFPGGKGVGAGIDGGELRESTAGQR
ncbi:hypothetical protein D3C78_1020110 [compost metagenome]